MKMIGWINRIIVLIALILLISSCKRKEPATLPDISTNPVTNITTTAAIAGGSIKYDGGAAINSKGVCWDSTTLPDITDSKSIVAEGTDVFNTEVPGLTPNSTYYLRAYATNSAGTAYGDEVTFRTYAAMDADLNGYYSVSIGSQTWLSENMKTTRYSNGDTIPSYLNLDDWTATTSGAYVVYNDDSTNNATYGKLYNWFAVVDSRNVCPVGWHVPTGDEWDILTSYLINNGFGYGGNGEDIAKSMAAKSGWISDTTAGTIGNDQVNNNSSGFTALPGGSRDAGGSFSNIGHVGLFWSTSLFIRYDNSGAMYLNSSSGYALYTGQHWVAGLSVRCLKDN